VGLERRYGRRVQGHARLAVVGIRREVTTAPHVDSLTAQRLSGCFVDGPVGDGVCCSVRSGDVVGSVRAFIADGSDHIVHVTER
jgi:hypothetical protein